MMSKIILVVFCLAIIFGILYYVGNTIVLKDDFIEEHEEKNKARRILGQEEEELDDDDIKDFIEYRLPEELETLFDRYIGDSVDCDLLQNILGDISKDGDFEGASTDYIKELL